MRNAECGVKRMRRAEGGVWNLDYVGQKCKGESWLALMLSPAFPAYHQLPESLQQDHFFHCGMKFYAIIMSQAVEIDARWQVFRYPIQ